MKETTSPSLVRIRRVAYFLGQEQKYSTTTETEDFVKGNDKIPFPKSVFAVARAIHEAELDPCGMNKAAVFEWANHILLGGPAPKVVPPAAKPAADQAANGKNATLVQAEEREEPVSTVNVPVRVAIYTLLVSARELTRLDRKPDSEELGKLIDAAAVKYLSALNQTENSYLSTAKPADAVVESAPAQVPPPIVEAAPAPAPQVPVPA
jgi:hypothetical protein